MTGKTPPKQELWWLGASMLVAGSVMIGRREEGRGEGGEDLEVEPAARSDEGVHAPAGTSATTTAGGKEDVHMEEPETLPPNVRVSSNLTTKV